MVGGTSSARTTVAWISRATSMPIPIILMIRIPESPNAPITTASSSAARLRQRVEDPEPVDPGGHRQTEVDQQDGQGASGDEGAPPLHHDDSS
jgi:hypothetical protein